MKKTEFEKYNTKYQIALRKKYIDTLPEDNDGDNYDVFSTFLFILAAPEQYEVEDEMLEYLNSHPDATVRELFEYFDSVAPSGLPPCASEWEDDEGGTQCKINAVDTSGKKPTIKMEVIK